MKIYELFDRDPRTARLANDGQAQIRDQADERAAAELRAELETFVCEGQFDDAIQRILDRYLANFGATRQESTWVSGFFGSGKSHLLKMLAHFWVNTGFDDGSTARNLPRGGLPDEIEAQFRELDTDRGALGASAWRELQRDGGDGRAGPHGIWRPADGLVDMDAFDQRAGEL